MARNDKFETEACSRCGGSGWYSYCQTWGRTCFQCGIRPHEQGTGRRFTERGAAAFAFYLTLLERPVNEFVPGTRFRDSAGWHTVVERRRPTISCCISPEGGNYHLLDEWELECNNFILGGVIGSTRYPVKLSEPEMAEALLKALAYQDSLTKQGKPRKRAQ